MIENGQELPVVIEMDWKWLKIVQTARVELEVTGHKLEVRRKPDVAVNASEVIEIRPKVTQN